MPRLRGSRAASFAFRDAADVNSTLCDLGTVSSIRRHLRYL